MVLDLFEGIGGVVERGGVRVVVSHLSRDEAAAKMGHPDRGLSPSLFLMRVLFCVEFFEPVFYVAKGAEEAEAGLGQVEGGVLGGEVFLAFVDAG
jgi:hypothetical protein